MLQNSTGDKLSQFTNISVHSHKEQNIIKLPRGNETPKRGPQESLWILIQQKWAEVCSSSFWADIHRV